MDNKTLDKANDISHRIGLINIAIDGMEGKRSVDDIVVRIVLKEHKDRIIPVLEDIRSGLEKELREL